MGIFLETELFHKGQRPAVNVGLSVSRVGKAAQNKAMKEVTGSMKLELAQFREVAAFAQFGSDLDAATQQQLLRGSVLMELLKQKLFVPMPTVQMVLSLFSGSNGYLDKVQLKEIGRFEKEWLEYMNNSHKDIVSEIQTTGTLDQATTDKIHAAMQSFVAETDFYPTA